jgi:hypothetical protein
MKILLRWPVVLLFGWLIALPSAAADVLTTERVEALLDASPCCGADMIIVRTRLRLRLPIRVPIPPGMTAEAAVM